LEDAAIAGRFRIGEILNEKVEVQAEDGEGISDFMDQAAGEAGQLGEMIGGGAGGIAGRFRHRPIL
jgi:hypothetical protein